MTRVASKAVARVAALSTASDADCDPSVPTTIVCIFLLYHSCFFHTS